MTAEASNLIVRPAGSEDVQAVLELWGALYREHRASAPEVIGELAGPGATVDLMLDLFRGGDRVLLVAERDGRVLGVVQATIVSAPEHPLLKPRTYAIINDVDVVPESRNEGVGEALVEAAEEWAKERDVHEFEAEIYTFNEGAASFYHELGYEVVSRIMFKRE